MAKRALHRKSFSELPTEHPPIYAKLHNVICHPIQVKAPAITPARQAGTWFTDPKGWKAELTLVVGYIPRCFTCPQTVTHPSSNHLMATDRVWNPRPLDRKSSDTLTVMQAIHDVRQYRNRTTFSHQFCFFPSSPFVFKLGARMEKMDRQTDGRARRVMRPIMI